MNVTAERLLQTEQFRGYVDSLENPGPFLEELDWAINGHKVSQLQKAFPPGLPVDQLVSSLLLNLQQDYESIITDLPPPFHAKETRGFKIHVGNTNQIGIHYDGEIKKGKGNVNPRIACVSLHFRDIDGTRFMYLENVQGELREGRYSRREVRRVYGKLNSHFGEDWRIGLARQLVQYARHRDMEVRGKVPGLFFFFGDTLSEYPMYSLNYVKTYLRSGIALEDIEFKPVPDEVQLRWANAMDFLRTKNPGERLQLLDQASREYTESYGRLCPQCFNERTIDLSTFEASCRREFERVFEEYLS